MRLTLILLVLILSGCADLSPQTRWHHAEDLASKAHWQKLRLLADPFILSAYVPNGTPQTDLLTVYIEGDGLAWISRSQPSGDPTPRNPIGLELALRHPQGIAVYLARPCQYVDSGDNKNCRTEFWTNKRFSPEVIEASNLAISELKRRFGATRLMLVGYSGGGAVAALVATRRNDVEQLVTVAGNMDHRKWAEMHSVSELVGSLNPADEWRALSRLSQRHFIGGHDEVVGRAVIDSYASHFVFSPKPEIVMITEFDHVCCWVDKWESIWVKNWN